MDRFVICVIANMLTFVIVDIITDLLFLAIICGIISHYVTDREWMLHHQRKLEDEH